MLRRSSASASGPGSWKGSGVGSGVASGAGAASAWGSASRSTAGGIRRGGMVFSFASAITPGSRSSGTPGVAKVCTGELGGVAGSSDAGTTTRASVPPCRPARSSAVTPCRAARRPATYRPRPRPCSDSGSWSYASGVASRAFSASSRSAVTPMPWSTTDSTTSPASSSHPETLTLASGGENVVAFSSSSASTCEMSSAACPATWVNGGSAASSTRS